MFVVSFVPETIFAESMKTSLRTLVWTLALIVCARPHASDTASHRFLIGETNFMLDGKPYQIRCGEIHAPRVPREYWRHRLRMAKAMGLNTVCAYLFWNMHEPSPGRFVWTGQADAAEFCKIAQQEGLWVLLRPGPYSCAEWEMGGFPWWLLKHDDIKLRTRDPQYLDAARKYLKEVGRVLTPLQVTHGGPILMVQVENEYGFFGKDAQYMGQMRQALLDAGFDVPLFACNPAEHLHDGYRSDLFPVVNFGSDPENAFKKLREVLPQGPLMCGEFYPGWFDIWGQPHHTGNAQKYLKDLGFMLDSGASFSIYMVHGGTTFGLWSGADRPFKPDTSSYDYDAPITEAGWPTEKFFQTRALLSSHLMQGESIPEPPAKNPVISFPPVELTECAPITANLPKPRTDSSPQPMEYYDQGYGCILYRTQVPPGPKASLEAGAVPDIGLVFLDGRRIGFMDRRTGSFKLDLTARSSTATLDILVEAMGRVNFGPEVHDHKGLQAPVTISGSDGLQVKTGEWRIYNLPLNDAFLARLHYSKHATDLPAFWRGNLQIPTPGDTFLDMSQWGKGVAWINGHCLGRFWNIGPTQTMYVPGPWLKRGKNQIIILDLIGPSKPVVAGLDQPILNRLRPELDFAQAVTSGR